MNRLDSAKELGKNLLKRGKRLLRKLDPELKLKISIWAWCEKIGDVFIFTSPGPGINRIEFDPWTEEDGDRDVIGFDFEFCIEKEKRRCLNA